MPEQAYRCKVLIASTLNMFEFSNFFNRGIDTRPKVLYLLQEEKKRKDLQRAIEKQLKKEEAVFSSRSSVKKPQKMTLKDMIKLEKPLDNLKTLRKGPV